MSAYMKPNLDMMMENMVNATLGENASSREKRMLTESLRSLVRLAKAEQMLEIKASVKKLTGVVTATANGRPARVDAMTNSDMAASRQGQLEFNPDEQCQLGSSSCSRNHRP
jgi:hypothetical protein